MADQNMVYKYCNLKNREAAFTTLPGQETDNIRFLGMHYLECLDAEPDCTVLNCRFAQGTVDPFVVR